MGTGIAFAQDFTFQRTTQGLAKSILPGSSLIYESDSLGDRKAQESVV